ncbi:hypothetical protein LCGC14_1185370 [marine sediment metagenome]|uniref:Uncharacterized protein n=1 Tax=marine sediment metagenome TaxID=412755 RepID=A0A0F9P3T3_9ZZZZ
MATKEVELAVLEEGYKEIARNLREFGYPDATTQMIRETHEAMQNGAKLPHGIIGMFAKAQIERYPKIFLLTH